MKKILYLAICLLFILIYLDMRRKVVNIDNKTQLTVWKRLGGSCYIMPYSYYGILSPKDNFIKYSNVGSMDFYWKDSLIYIPFATYNDELFIVNKSKRWRIMHLNSDHKIPLKEFNRVGIDVRYLVIKDTSGKILE